MNINDLLAGHNLPPLPMRAWLSRTDFLIADTGKRGWRLEDCWVAPEKRPMLTTYRLRELELLDGSPCLAIVADAIGPEWNWQDDEELTDEHYRTLVYLLNPADPTVWEAIHSWEEGPFRFISILCEGGVSMSPLPQNRDAYYDARSAELDELECDLLAGKLLKLIAAGQLEKELKSKLGITRPMYVAIVETPMLCKAMRPLSPAELAEAEAYLAHKRWAASLEG